MSDGVGDGRSNAATCRRPGGWPWRRDPFGFRV